MFLRIFVILLLAAAIFGGAWFALHELYIRPEQRLKADNSRPPPTPPPDPSLADFQRCLELRQTQPLSEARTALEQFLREFPSSTRRDAAHDILGEINAQEFFSVHPNDSNTYVVKSGDNLFRVAARTRLPVELLVHLNRLDGRYPIHPNQRLLAPKCSFRMVIQQKARRVVLYNDNKFFRQYPAAVWSRGNRKEDLLPKQTGRVTEKRAFNNTGNNTGSVTTAQLRYYDAQHMILVNIPGHSLYTHPDDPKAVGQRPPGGGIGMAPLHMSEISVLLPVGASVSIE